MTRQRWVGTWNRVPLALGAAALVVTLARTPGLASHIGEEERAKYLEALAKDHQAALDSAQRWKQMASDARFDCIRFNRNCGMEVVYDALAREADIKADATAKKYETCRQDASACGHETVDAKSSIREPAGFGVPRVRAPEELKRLITEAEVRLRLEPDPDKRADIKDEIALRAHSLRVGAPREFPSLLENARKELGRL